MALIHWLITHLTPLFIVASPILSYGDQINSMHKSRSSAGFSLDIPLIMLTASILKIFYWFGARFDLALLLQAILMIIVQVVLLHVALTHRPNATISHKPFEGILPEYQPFPRPYDFWQWRPHRPYWQFIAVFSATLLVLQLVLGTYAVYTDVLGYLGLAIEAVLPLPQIMANHRRRSCKGFRISVLITWLLGDASKLSYFFLSSGSAVPLAFRMCGLFQAGCDCFLGVQYWMYGDGEVRRDGILSPVLEREMEFVKT
ncbi:hypothetical protein NA57DRAFT_43645 [Rhizodiscina lignyota]|uniref:PQ loop repeat protein n=1 Tax=Rhizodiscina lignyota TaxID=1504668 RepID=A0A9P4I9P7_9PEZI|nr:hypothetical protein NA57DRAFT_43645 [Rhizodiscina lignyota]